MVSNNQRFVIVPETMKDTWNEVRNGPDANAAFIVDSLGDYCDSEPYEQSEGPVILSAFGRVFNDISYNERPGNEIAPCPSGRRGGGGGGGAKPALRVLLHM